MNKTIASLALLLSLTSSVVLAEQPSFVETPAPDVPHKIEITFVGNSLTRHPPKSDIGWNNDYGMAATQLSRDYVHMTANKLHLPYENIYARNIYPFETDEIAAARITKSLVKAFTSSKYIVIQISENVNEKSPEQMAAFSRTYPALIDSIPNGKRFFCISSYWHSSAKDEIIKESCNRSGGHYVYIGDIQLMQKLNMPEKQFQNPDVNNHPHDYAMNIIASRLAAKIKNSN